MNPRRVSIFVLIDALGWKVLEHREFLTDLLPYRKPLRTVLGFSSGAIPSILTGQPPVRNGHWNLFYYDPVGSPFRWLRHFDFLPDRVLNHRITRKVIKELGRRVLGMGKCFECCVSPRLLPWFNWVEKKNIYGPGGVTGAPTIFDQLARAGVPYRVYSYHHWTDREIFEQARRDLESTQDRFFFLYLSEMDQLLHNDCGREDHIGGPLHWYEDQMRRLFRQALELDAEANFAVFSDHGMTPVRNHYDLVKDIRALRCRMPDDFLAVYDSTMARFWFFSDAARREIVNLLRSLPCGRILPDEELEQLGILFADRRYGQIVFLLHPGWLLKESDFNGKGWNPVGMHGYHPDDPDSDAIFLTNRTPPVPMRNIADLYPCMREAAARVQA